MCPSKHEFDMKVNLLQSSRAKKRGCESGWKGEDDACGVLIRGSRSHLGDKNAPHNDSVGWWGMANFLSF